MAAEGVALVNDDVNKLLLAIKRISGGGSQVAYGDLIKDEEVEQTFEAIMGTLKAARKRKLVSFVGELLLMGKDDAVIVSIVEPEAVPEAAPAEAAAPPATPPATPPPEPEEAAGPPATPPPEEEKAVTEQAAVPAEEVSAMPPHPTETMEESQEDADKGEKASSKESIDRTASTGWKVDTSYIDWRTADPNRLEGRRDSAAPEVPHATPGAGTTTATPSTQTKAEDGKWSQVNTGYIDWRTKDPDRLEARSSTVVRRSSTDLESNPNIAANAAKVSEKDEDGKWKAVNTGYINHRTGDCERLDGRKSIQSGVKGTVSEVSATVKKATDGKWQVDTSYIKHRTADTNNLYKKYDAQNANNYADPDETKFSYEQLTMAANERPAEINPANREKYLSDADFMAVLSCTPDDFTKMPKWKQQKLKKDKDLF